MEVDRGRRGEGLTSPLLPGLSAGAVGGFLPHRARETVGDGGGGGAFSDPRSPRGSRSESPAASGGGYIEHRVSKLDTLAGVAIRYGVEVADIKRMNGLVTDLQMFAHKKLKIPLPGRHPPSPILDSASSGSREETPPQKHHENGGPDVSRLLTRAKPPRASISPAMSSLQGFYGLKPSSNNTAMEAINNGATSGTVLLPPGSEVELASRASATPLSASPIRSQKLRNSVNGHSSTNGHHLPGDFSLVDATDEDDTSNRSSPMDKFVRRRQQQKTDFDSPCRTPELLIKDDTAGTPPLRSSGGKGLALRPKSGSKADPTPTRTSSESLLSNGFLGVRKSSSTPNFEESDGSSLWSTGKWAIKTEAITRPLLDSWPKLLNKIALD